MDRARVSEIIGTGRSDWAGTGPRVRGGPTGFTRRWGWPDYSHRNEGQKHTRIAEDSCAIKIRVRKNGDFVEEGWGKNSCGRPELCLAELAGQRLRQKWRPAAPPAGELIKQRNH